MTSADMALTNLLSQDLNVSLPSAPADASANGSLHNTTPQGVSYRQQVAAINVISYSTSCTLHACPRKFLLEKLTADGSSDETDNIDFLYGHAVGGGVQNFAHTRDMRSAVWDSFLSWRGDLDIELPKKKKSFWMAAVAVMKFAGSLGELLGDWEIAVMADGKPAIELAFRLDLGNSYFYMGHIDAVLYSPSLRQFMVLELKTTGFKSVADSQYKNSAQALGYSLIVDKLAALLNADSNNYQVLYLVYKTGQQEWEALPFVKSRQQRASWLFQLRLDCTMLDMYRSINHFPTYGESCYHFFRDCEFFGTCDLKSQLDVLMKNIKIAGVDDVIEGVDFNFNMAEIMEVV